MVCEICVIKSLVVKTEGKQVSVLHPACLELTVQAVDGGVMV